MTDKFYITTPIYYVNDKPHIGHAYTTIAADVLARFQRARGRDVFFLTGTDEHGIKICKSAAARDTTPGDLADRVVVHFYSLWRELEITHDDFIRTSSARHEARVASLVATLLEKGQIYRGRYEGWYDEGQEEFVSESSAAAADYLSTVSGQPLVRYSEEAWFFRLSSWIPALIEHIESHPSFILPVVRRNEILSKLRLGVEDLCISRPAGKLMNWGVPMPNDPDQSVYVWIDALANYLTGLGYPPVGDAEDERRFSRYWPADIHLLGKDILWFHAVYWPALLLALDLPLPVTIFAHGWWLSEGRKMSKSLGNFISREEIAHICRDYGVDVFRYYLLRAVPFGQDGNFSREGLFYSYNAELANGVGNLLSRTVNMICRYCDGAVPEKFSPGQEEEGVIAAARGLIREAPGHLEKLEFQQYLEAVLRLEGATNRYIENTEPFKLARDPANLDRVGQVMRTCAEAVRLILEHLLPVMPVKAAAGLEMLGLAPTAVLGRDWDAIPAGTRPVPGPGLFPRRQEVRG